MTSPHYREIQSANGGCSGRLFDLWDTSILWTCLINVQKLINTPERRSYPNETARNEYRLNAEQSDLTNNRSVANE